MELFWYYDWSLYMYLIYGCQCSWVSKIYHFIEMEFSWLLFYGRVLKSLNWKSSYSWGRIFVPHKFHEHKSLINNDDDDATVAAVWSGHLPGLGWTYRITVAGTVRLSNRLVTFSTIPSLSDSHSCHKTLYLSYTWICIT